MALNDDWLADVRRWYFDERDTPSGTPAEQAATDFVPPAEPELGYEAAQPALQMHLLRELHRLEGRES
jgi:hypothetical protein